MARSCRFGPGFRQSPSRQLSCGPTPKPVGAVARTRRRAGLSRPACLLVPRRRKTCKICSATCRQTTRHRRPLAACLQHPTSAAQRVALRRCNICRARSAPPPGHLPTRRAPQQPAVPCRECPPIGQRARPFARRTASASSFGHSSAVGLRLMQRSVRDARTAAAREAALSIVGYSAGRDAHLARGLTARVCAA